MCVIINSVMIGRGGSQNEEKDQEGRGEKYREWLCPR